MAKRITVFLLIISMMICTFSSCVELDIYVPQIGGGITNNGFGSVPTYTENYTYLPIIECNGKEYRVDELAEADSGEGYFGVGGFPAVVDFYSLEYTYKNREGALIAVGTVIDNPVQVMMYDENEQGEILCPFRIDEILYQDENSPALDGEVIELLMENVCCVYTDSSGEVKSSIYANGVPFISGARYLLYLTYSEKQPEYNYKRYDVSTDGKFEITNYSSLFDFKSIKAKEPEWGKIALRYYDLHNESVFIHDAEKYPLSESLGSTDEVKTVGLRIGETVVQGLEFISAGYTCTGYSQKDKEYTFDYHEEPFGGYDITSGTVPEGCPIIRCDVGDEVEIISPVYPMFNVPDVTTISGVNLYDTSGKEVRWYFEDNELIAPGVYWLCVEVCTWFVPNDAEFKEPPEVGDEFISEQKYLFCIIMD